MFKTNADFDEALLILLAEIKENDDFVKWQKDMSNEQLNDLLKYAAKHEYIAGITPSLGSHGDLQITVASPRLTEKGLKYLEGIN